MGLTFGVLGDSATMAHVYKLAYSAADTSLAGTPLEGIFVHPVKLQGEELSDVLLLPGGSQG